MTEPVDTPLTRRPDAYEAAFMGVDEQVVLRDKMSVHPGLHVAALLAVIGGVVAILAAGGSVLVAALPILAGLILFSMSATLRTTVSTDNVHVQYGVIGPKIPMATITSVKAVDYSWWKYGGWGIRYALSDGSWCYNMIGDGGKAVEILFEKNGKAKKVLVASKQNVLLADAISQAMRAEEVAFDFDASSAKSPESVDTSAEKLESVDLRK
jgi:hypothetical protein